MLLETIRNALLAVSLSTQPPTVAAAECMARVVYGEARGHYGQMLHVASVLWNRAEGRAENVCYQAKRPRQFIGYRTKPVDDLDWRYSAEIAAHFLAGRFVDTTGGATHFVDGTRYRPAWMRHMEILAEVGPHVYMRKR